MKRNQTKSKTCFAGHVTARLPSASRYKKLRLVMLDCEDLYRSGTKLIAALHHIGLTSRIEYSLLQGLTATKNAYLSYCVLEKPKHEVYPSYLGAPFALLMKIYLSDFNDVNIFI